MQPMNPISLVCQCDYSTVPSSLRQQWAKLFGIIENMESNRQLKKLNHVDSVDSNANITNVLFVMCYVKSIFGCIELLSMTFKLNHR